MRGIRYKIDIITLKYWMYMELYLYTIDVPFKTYHD